MGDSEEHAKPEEKQPAEDIIKLTDDEGITKKVLKAGEGWKTPTSGCEVKVHYVGTLLDGTKFDSSRDRSDPFSFTLGVGQVIKGWDTGVASMKKGEVAVLTCTAEYAYGKAGSPPKIPPNATLQFEVELISWTDGEKDISEKKDHGILKKINKNGDGWETPKEEAKVTIKISGKVHEGAEFEPEHTVNFVFGEDQLSAALETAIGTMKKGEQATITFQPAYGFGAAGNAEKGVPPNAVLIYEIELLDFQKEKESWDMDTTEKIGAATKRKEEGNTLFKESKFGRATKKYKKALTFVDSDYGVADEDKDKFKQLKLLLFLNVAACKLHTKDYGGVKENCNKALEIDPKNVKALLRRAKAYIDSDDWDLARHDIKKVLEQDANNNDAKVELARLNKKVAEHTSKEKKAFGGMFERLSKLSTEHEEKKSAAEKAATEKEKVATEKEKAATEKAAENEKSEA